MLSTSEVAALAKCQPRTVLRAIAARELGAERFGRDWVIPDDEGRAWAAAWRPGPFGPKRAAHAAGSAPGGARSSSDG